MKKLILIDGNSIFHRAFYALPPSLKTPEGEPSNAVYGFTSMLLNLINYEKPDCIAVAFDLKGKTFRHKEYAEYKGTRTKGPDELYVQFPLAKKVLKTFEIPIFEMAGFEADDILGTLSKQADESKKVETYIVTGDKDALQLASKHTKIIMPVKGLSQTMSYGPELILEKFGLRPDQIPDQKGLQGDASDNIKGVAGVGEKTAKTLLQKYDNVEGIYEHLDEISGKLHERLEKDRESAFFSKKLATIVRDVPKELDLEACMVHEYDREKVENLFLELGFNSLIKKLNTFDKYYSQVKIESDSQQQSLF